MVGRGYCQRWRHSSRGNIGTLKVQSQQIQGAGVGLG